MKLDLDQIVERKEYYLSKRFLLNNKKVVITVITVLFLFFSAIFFFQNKDKKEIENKLFTEEDISKGDEITSAGEDEFIIIDISGAVESPGVFELEAKARVEDAIKAAGGLKEEADISKINRAEQVKDGQKIYIYSKGEEVTSSTDKYKLVNINSATSEELRTVNGIGPAMAERIIIYRGENGNFENLEDLKNVEGIGEKTFEKLKKFLTV